MEGCVAAGLLTISGRRLGRRKNSACRSLVTKPENNWVKLALPIIRIGLGPWGKGIPMMKSDEVVARFTRRAEKLRSIASNVKDREIRSAMLIWAADYDRLAERAIELSSELDQKYRVGGAPARGPGTGDLVHSIGRQSATAKQPWWRRTATLHHLGYGLTAVFALAVIAHTLHGGKPGQIP